jgi:hypothetical protein
VLVARIVVDVDGYAAQRGDLGGERGEGVVVLSVGGRLDGVRVIDWGFVLEGGGRFTAPARRLRTWLWFVRDGGYGDAG